MAIDCDFACSLPNGHIRRYLPDKIATTKSDITYQAEIVWMLLKWQANPFPFHRHWRSNEISGRLCFLLLVMRRMMASAISPETKPSFSLSSSRGQVSLKNVAAASILNQLSAISTRKIAIACLPFGGHTQTWRSQTQPKRPLHTSPKFCIRDTMMWRKWHPRVFLHGYPHDLPILSHAHCCRPGS